MPGVLLVMHRQSYLSTLLTFPLLPPSVYPVMSDKVLQEKNKDNVTGRNGRSHFKVPSWEIGLWTLKERTIFPKQSFMEQKIVVPPRIPQTQLKPEDE